MTRSSYDRHLGENEATFRQRDESVRGFSDSKEDMSIADSMVPFLCECANEKCSETIDIDYHEYGAIHASRQSYVIVPGHEVKSTEEVVLQQPSYLVVEKR